MTYRRTGDPLLQGEVRIASDVDAKVATILGSCVATLIWDPEIRVGGVNHLLLPDHMSLRTTDHGSEVNLMELLINGILRKGGRKENFRAKIFGGAHVVEGLGDTGIRNSEFVTSFLRDERIPCVSRSIGGKFARKLQFWPAAGRVRLKMLAEPDVSLQPVQRPSSLMTMKRQLEFSGVELL